MDRLIVGAIALLIALPAFSKTLDEYYARERAEQYLDDVRDNFYKYTENKDKYGESYIKQVCAGGSMLPAHQKAHQSLENEFNANCASENLNNYMYCFYLGKAAAVQMRLVNLMKRDCKQGD